MADLALDLLGGRPPALHAVIERPGPRLVGLLLKVVFGKRFEMVGRTRGACRVADATAEVAGPIVLHRLDGNASHCLRNKQLRPAGRAAVEAYASAL